MADPFFGTFPRRYVELANGTVLSVVEAGPTTGPVIVLAHGGGVDQAVMTWGLVIDDLAAAGYRVLAPDLPGYGASPKLSRSYTTELVIDTLEGLLDAYGVDAATFAGLSMGGAGSLGLALRDPSRVARLVLVGSWGLQPNVRLHRFSRWVVHSGLYEWGNRHIGQSRVLTAGLASNLLGKWVWPNDPIVPALIAETRHSSARLCFDEFQKSELLPTSTRTNYQSQLTTLTQPVLFVHGPFDSAVPLGWIKRAAAAVPNSQLWVARGAGHWVPRGRPAAFRRTLLDFLAST